MLPTNEELNLPGLQHKTVLLHEAVEALSVRPDGVYVDGTFGRGGHSAVILAQLGPSGRLIALDKDPLAVAQAKKIEDQRLRVRAHPTRTMAARPRLRSRPHGLASTWLG